MTLPSVYVRTSCDTDNTDNTLRASRHFSSQSATGWWSTDRPLPLPLPLPWGTKLHHVSNKTKINPIVRKKSKYPHKITLTCYFLHFSLRVCNKQRCSSCSCRCHGNAHHKCGGRSFWRSSGGTGGPFGCSFSRIDGCTFKWEEAVTFWWYKVLIVSL